METISAKFELDMRTVFATLCALVFGALGMVIVAIFNAQLINSSAKFLAPFIEEPIKFIAVVALFFIFNKRTNAFLFAIAVGLGFAVLENIFFASTRVPFVLLHIIATMIATSSLIKSEKEGWHKAKWAVPVFLVLAILLHLSFNVLAGSFGIIWDFSGLI